MPAAIISWMMFLDVAACVSRPNHTRVVNSGWPSSRNVGVSGKSRKRSGLVMAIALSAPLLICGNEFCVWAKPSGELFASSALTCDAEP